MQQLKNVRGELRNGRVRQQLVSQFCRLREWARLETDRGSTEDGIALMWQRVDDLDRRGQREAVLVNLRLLEEVLKSSNRPPWVPPSLLSSDLTGEQITHIYNI